MTVYSTSPITHRANMDHPYRDFTSKPNRITNVILGVNGRCQIAFLPFGAGVGGPLFPYGRRTYLHVPASSFINHRIGLVRNKNLSLGDIRRKLLAFKEMFIIV